MYDYGWYYVIFYIFVSLVCLIGIFIVGGLVDMGGEMDRRVYWRLFVFVIVSYVGVFGCFFWVWVWVKGWDWGVKWWDVIYRMN